MAQTRRAHRGSDFGVGAATRPHQPRRCPLHHRWPTIWRRCHSPASTAGAAARAHFTVPRLAAGAGVAAAPRRRFAAARRLPRRQRDRAEGGVAAARQRLAVGADGPRRRGGARLLRQLRLEGVRVHGRRVGRRAVAAPPLRRARDQRRRHAPRERRRRPLARLRARGPAPPRARGAAGVRGGRAPHVCARRPPAPRAHRLEGVVRQFRRRRRGVRRPRSTPRWRRTTACRASTSCRSFPRCRPPRARSPSATTATTPRPAPPSPPPPSAAASTSSAAAAAAARSLAPLPAPLRADVPPARAARERPSSRAST